MADNARLLKLERLLSQLADEGASAGLYQQIESLLLDHPELQDYYWRWMDTHVLLGIDKGAIVSKESRVARAINGDDAAAADRKVDYAPGHGKRFGVSWGVAIAAAAASAVLAVLAEQSLRVDEPLARFEEGFAGESFSVPQEPFSCRIPLITRVSHQGPFFLDGKQTGQAVQVDGPGNVSIKMVSGESVEGYLLELQPGESVDITVASDACDRNAVSVTELDASGAPLQSVVTFENYSSVDNERRQEPRVSGLLGTWSTYNRTNHPQYYLFTGIYRLSSSQLKTPEDERTAWHMSDSQKIIDGQGVVLLGWEDYDGKPHNPDSTLPYDHDYDDTYALLRVSSPDDRSGAPKGLQLSCSATQPGLSLRTEGEHRYRLTLAPGECALMTVTRDAVYRNAFYLIDPATQEVLWASSGKDTERGSLGGIYFENGGHDIAEFELVGESVSADPKSGQSDWSCLKYETSRDYSGGYVVGFDDVNGDGDFNDLRAIILSAPKILNPPIDDLIGTWRPR